MPRTPPLIAESQFIPPREDSFLELTYPSEECENQRDLGSGHNQPSAHDDSPLRSACQSLSITFELGVALYVPKFFVSIELITEAPANTSRLSLYFTNMTAFSLFSRDMLEAKLSSIKRATDREALLAAMFAYAARFKTPSPDEGFIGSCPAAAQFASIASQRLHQALEEHGDRSPPLCIVQAYALLSFYELSRSVRPRSWRVLGECIRLAYEMRLHAVDEGFAGTDLTEFSTQDIEQWVAREEHRRTWWAIWEMDVFASTIRRLPTAIDWAQNATLLPVSDDKWFKRSYQTSCFLAPEPNARWKSLVESGNRCAKAWFILVNSVMRNTQVLVYAADTNRQLYEGDRSAGLTLMANILSCTSMSLPEEVVYNGELLSFREQGDGTTGPCSPQADADKYGLHLMIQLSHFMINHHFIRSQARWLVAAGGEAASSSHPSSSSEAVWKNYLNASEEIITIVRNSSPHHHRYVNPFLVNTIWFAATAQCSFRVFGPSTLSRQYRLAASNLDVLRLTIDRFMTFWGSTEMLKAKLARIERGLVGLMHPEQSERQPSVRQDANDPGLMLRNDNTVGMRAATTVGPSQTDWTSIFGMGNENFDHDFFNSMDGGFPFGLDDLIIPTNV